MFRSHQDSSARSATSTLVFFMGGFAVKNLPAVQERCRFLKIPWSRKWQPTPAVLPEKSHGWRSLVGYCPWGVTKESGPYLATQAATFFITFYLSLTYLLPQNPQLKKERKESAGY